MDFAVHLSYRLPEAKNVFDRMCYLTIEKTVASTQDLLQTPRKWHHMGITSYDESIIEPFKKTTS